MLKQASRSKIILSPDSILLLRSGLLLAHIVDLKASPPFDIPTPATGTAASAGLATLAALNASRYIPSFPSSHEKEARSIPKKEDFV